MATMAGELAPVATTCAAWPISMRAILEDATTAHAHGQDRGCVGAGGLDGASCADGHVDGTADADAASESGALDEAGRVKRRGLVAGQAAAATHALRQDAGGAIARRCDRALDAQVDGVAVAIFGGRRHRL
ncbi:hypothetical protein G6F66_014448 [Rhizopus arrhizus]|nr:hypothetical protein G6F66_014448 [Rhizopus arrhizus]